MFVFASVFRLIFKSILVYLNKYKFVFVLYYENVCVFVFASVFGAGCLVACSACSVVHVWPGVELGVEALTSGRSGSRVACYNWVWCDVVRWVWCVLVHHDMVWFGLV